MKNRISRRNIFLMASGICIVLVLIAAAPVVIRVGNLSHPRTADRIFENFQRIVSEARTLPPDKRSINNLMPLISKSRIVTVKNGVTLSKKLPTSMTISEIDKNGISVSATGTNPEECWEFIESLKTYSIDRVDYVKINGAQLSNFPAISFEDLSFLCNSSERIYDTGLIMLIQVGVTFK